MSDAGIGVSLTGAVLSAEGVSKVYGSASLFGGSFEFTAVDGVNLELQPGRTLGIVGESGCGKSTLSRILAGIAPPTGGTVRIDGKPIDEGTRREIRERLCNVQMVFQSPAGSLDPRMRIDQIVAEPLDVHRKDLGSKQKRLLVSQIMGRVGLDDSYLSRYPHELSGGQQQRIGIARALITDPKVVICDEAVSALDVSVQAQIINLLLEIQQDTGVAFIFISHDLSVVAAIADEICVMYMGRFVEEGTAQTVLSKPAHPYTKVLLESAFVPDPAIEKTRMRSSVADTAPTSGRPLAGCPFRPRCGVALPICETVMPDLLPTDRGDTRVACHNYHAIEPR
jgi:oligopeptide/dipeptide ABC transporter ATP-binding protein